LLWRIVFVGHNDRFSAQYLKRHIGDAAGAYIYAAIKPTDGCIEFRRLVFASVAYNDSPSFLWEVF
jgi:hypothetical protein